MPGRRGNASAPFNYAVLCDASTMKVATTTLQRPFDWPLDASIKVDVVAASFDWTTGPWRLPDAPINATESHRVNLTLVPYGSAKVYHISMFPVLHESINTKPPY